MRCTSPSHGWPVRRNLSQRICGSGQRHNCSVSIYCHSRLTRQFLDRGGQPRGFGFQSGQLRVERGDSLCCHGIEQAGLFLHQLRKFVFGAFAQATIRRAFSDSYGKMRRIESGS